MTVAISSAIDGEQIWSVDRISSELALFIPNFKFHLCFRRSPGYPEFSSGLQTLAPQRGSCARGQRWSQPGLQCQSGWVYGRSGPAELDCVHHQRCTKLRPLQQKQQKQLLSLFFSQLPATVDTAAAGCFTEMQSTKNNSLDLKKKKKPYYARPAPTHMLRQHFSITLVNFERV